MRKFYRYLLQVFVVTFFLSLFSVIAIAQDDQDDLPDDATPRKIFYTFSSSSNSTKSSASSSSKTKNQNPQKGKTSNTSKQPSKNNSKNNPPNNPQPRKKPQPGAQVKIELERNGVKQFVSSNTVFYSGDKVRFHFKVNFPAYVAVINQGSSGRVSLLFPCGSQKNLIEPLNYFKIPTGSFPFKFDNTAGEENLTFVMSSSPISLVNEAIAAGADVCSQKLLEAYQTTFEKLNTTALGEGRDIVLSDDKDEDGTNASYFLTSLEKLKKVVGIKLKLKHQ